MVTESSYENTRVFAGAALATNTHDYNNFARRGTFPAGREEALAQALWHAFDCFNLFGPACWLRCIDSPLVTCFEYCDRNLRACLSPVQGTID